MTARRDPMHDLFQALRCRSLTVRVTAYATLIVVVFSSLVVAANVYESEKVLRQRLLAKADDIGRLIAGSVASHVAELRALELEVILEDIARQSEVTQIEVVDTASLIIADGNETDGSGSFLAMPDSPVVAEALKTRKNVIRVASHVDAAYPVLRAGELVGAVHLKLSFDGVRQALWEATVRYLRVGFILIIVAVPLCAMLMSRATRQIRHLTATARSIAAGDTFFAFDDDPGGDVGELQGAFKLMLANLATSRVEIEYLAFNDPVTWLPNRQAFFRGMASILKAATPETAGALMFIDLDGFKKVNDTLGHGWGDELLKQVAARLCRYLNSATNHATANSPPLISRFAGDEFTIFLPQANSRAAVHKICSEILDVLNEPFRCDSRDIAISASIGVAMFPDDGKDYDTLLKHADFAMYAAKSAGRRGVHFYSAGLERRAYDRLTLEGELRLGLENRQFEVFYQPMVSCADGRIVGAEALVRWRHPVRGLLAPSHFLASAEEAGLLADIGWHVLERASLDAKKFAAAGRPLAISVNVAAVQFERADFAERVLATLEHTGLPPELLVLELTEAPAMRDPEAAIARLAPLRKKGVRLAVDDFGVGYSSLSYLSRLPISALKIDRSFIAALQNGVDDEVLVTTILHMAEGLRLDTVAEGIETAAEFEFCRDRGVTTAQGFLFSAPLPGKEFAELLRRFRPSDWLSAAAVSAVA